MKKSIPPSVPDKPNTQDDYEKLFRGLVRDIRAEAQNLVNIFEGIEKKGDLIDASVRKKELEAAFEDSRKIYNNNHKQIEDIIGSIRKLMAENPCLYDWAGDEITIIENLFERVSLKWDELSVNGKTVENERLLKNISEINKFLGEITYHACLLTIPNRVNEHLDQLWSGQTLNFHETFNDELPLKTDRDKILLYLYSHPRAVHGAVDARNGIIYKASHNIWRRIGSYVLIMAALVIGGVLIYFFSDAGKWLNLPDWQPGKKMEYLIGYIFINFGGFSHIGIDMLKQSRSGREGTFTALSDFLLWIHVKEVSILAGIISLWIGFLGCVLILKNTDWQTAFFVGYSIDSFVDLFLMRFAGTVSRQTELLQSSLKKQKDET